MSEVNIHCAHCITQAPTTMFDHLLDFDPPAASLAEATPIEKAQPTDIVAAQVATADWLDALGAPNTQEAELAAATASAQQAFTALTAPNMLPDKQRNALVAIKVPEAVRHLTGMLTAYDWEFVNQAKELRGYAVAQIMEETKHPDAKIRLKALEMLGRVTEVALFTERVEIKKTDMTDEEIDRRIKDKLSRFMEVSDVIDVGAVESENIEAADEPPTAH